MHPSARRLLPPKGTRAILDLGGLATHLDSIVSSVADGDDGVAVTIAAVADGATAVKATLDLGQFRGGVLDTIVRAKTAGTDGNAITVTLDADAVLTKASLAVATKTTHDNSVFQAQTGGTDGNDLTLAFVADATLTAASLDLATKTTHCDTVIEAKAAGVGGDDLTVAFVADGTGTGTLNESAHPTLVFHYQDGVTTVANFETAVTASTYLAVKTGGTGATALTAADDAFSATHLAGGADRETLSESSPTIIVHFQDGVSTVADVEALITASSSLIEVKTAGTGATVLHVTVDEFTATHLAGGAAEETIEETSTAVTIHYQPGETTVTEIETLIGTSSLIEVDTGGTGANVLGDAGADDTFGPRALAGGTDAEMYFDVTDSAIVAHFTDNVTTVDDFEAALVADANVAGLIYVSTGGTGANVLKVSDDDFSATHLAMAGSTSSAAPTATDGTLGQAHPFYSDQAMVTVRSTAGSGTMTAIVDIWGWSPSDARWHLIGSLNGGTAIPEASADYIDYSELLVGIGTFTRLYAQLGSLGGSGTKMRVDVDHVRGEAIA